MVVLSMKKYRPLILMLFLACVLVAWATLQWLAWSYDAPYCLVENGLYVGSSVDAPPHGTQAVVNLCGKKDPYDVEFSLWEPVFEAGKEPDLDWLRRTVAFIREQRQNQRTTYVHCLAGMNRSGAVVTAYLMAENGWDRDQALAYLQKKRPQIQPNPILLRLLRDWQNEIRKGRE